MTTAENNSAVELRRLIRERGFETHFQPILDVSGAGILGHEALTRAPTESIFQSPPEMLACASDEGLDIELDLLWMELAIQRFAASGATGRLFVNLLPATLLGCADLPQRLQTILASVALRPRRLVIEVTEHGLSDDASEIHAGVKPLRALGCEIAIDDLGAGSSGLKIWSELRPDYVKIDGYFTAQIEHDVVAAEMLRSMLDMAHVMGSRVVAEQVENSRQYALLRDLGVDYLQGYYFGKPQSEPLRNCAAPESLVQPAPARIADSAEDLLIERPPLRPDTRIDAVMALFQEHSDWDSLAVAEEGRPIGIVRRDTLLTLLSKPLYPEIFNRKAIVKAMDANPVVVDARARLDQVSRLVTGTGQSRVNEDFIIARHGDYIGIGRTIELLRQITASQLQAAKQSNPLTQLPGNREIDEQLSRLLTLRIPFVLCHGDLDHFKSFNDEYGYRQGDQVLLHVADLFRRAAGSGADFVGHLGGDDFILMLRNVDWKRRLSRVFDSFRASIPNFYSAEHRASGGIQGLDRDGIARSFPLMTLSVGVVQIDADRSIDQDAVMASLRRSKSLAKAQEGHALVLDCAGAIDYLDTGDTGTMPVLQQA